MSAQTGAQGGFYADAKQTPLQRVVDVMRRQLGVVLFFSAIVNILQLTVSIYMMQVFDRVMASRSLDTLTYLTVLAVAAILLMALLDSARGRIMSRIATWMDRALGPDAFARAAEQALRGSNYKLEAIRDLGQVRGMIGGPGIFALFDAPWIPIYLLVTFMLHPVLGLIGTVGAVVLFLLALANEYATRSHLGKANSTATRAMQGAEAALRNAEVIDALGMMPGVTRRWYEETEKASAMSELAADRSQFILALTKFLRLGIQLAILGVGAYLTLQQELTSGAMIAGSIVIGRALAPVEQAIGIWKQWVGVRQAWRRLNQFFSMPRLARGTIALPTPEGHLSVERLVYAAPNTNRSILKGVSFALSPGEVLGVIGPSAAGKTTLARLLIGTLQPIGGNVRLDGADVFTWQREDFGQYVGYLPQDVELFSGTVLQNISRFVEGPADLAIEAAQMAGCHEMILRLPQGYDTEIGDAGVFLSGGQRQQVGLARALYGRPRLVILDEPNSNLDGDAERALLRALVRLRQERITTIVISHSPNIVQAVDKMLVLRDGAVEHFGPRAEIMEKVMRRPVAVPGGADPGRLAAPKAAPGAAAPAAPPGVAPPGAAPHEAPPRRVVV